MKYAFNYHGTDKEGNRHFSIITDNEQREEKLVGIGIMYTHYMMKPDRSVKKLNYDQIGYKTTRPNKDEASKAWYDVSSYFHPLLPLWGVPIIIGQGTYFFQQGGWETHTGDNWCIQDPCTCEYGSPDFKNCPVHKI